MNRREFVEASGGLVLALCESSIVKTTNKDGEDVVIFAFNGVPNQAIYTEMGKACQLLGIKAMLVPNCNVSVLGRDQECFRPNPPRKLMADGKCIGYVIWANIEAGLVCYYAHGEEGLSTPLRRVVEKFDHLEWVYS